jgi:hypothetical protein
LSFLYAYLTSLREKIWLKRTNESEGTYALTSELIGLFQFVLQDGPIAHFKTLIREKLISFLTTPIDSWSPVDSDVLLSVLSGGGFPSLQVGSRALYKDAQPCIIVGFSESGQAENGLASLSEDDLNNFDIYLHSRKDTKPLIIFCSHEEDSQLSFSSDIKVVNLHDLNCYRGQEGESQLSSSVF